jgi:HEAT repeat protein
VTSLQDGDPDVREEAISALVEVYTERDRTGPVGRFLESFSDEYERSSVPPYTAVDPTVYRGLSSALKDEKTHIRADAAYAIGILGGGSSIPDLVAALQDPTGDVRAAAATALGKCATAAEGRSLIPLLADNDTTVRNRALQSIGVLRVYDAGPPLREMFVQHKRRELGTRVLSALARTGDPAQADLYKELLFSNDPEMRKLAVEGLARIADASMLPAFKTDFQREKDGDVRMAYGFGIVRLGDRAFLDSLVLALGGSGSSARHARDLILELGPSLAPDLYPYLADKDPSVRGAVCDLLAALGDTNAAPKLTPLLADPNSKVADRANRAIEKLRRAGPAPAPRP